MTFSFLRAAPSRFLMLGLGALCAAQGSARAEEEAGVMFFDLRAAAPVDDFQMGGRVGVGTDSRIGWDFFLDFEMRLQARALMVRESETLHYQFREERFTFGPGVLARIPLGSPHAFYTVGGGVGLSPAWYRGSNRAAASAGVGWLETGFRFTWPSGVDLGLAYQFFPLPGVSSHRAALSLGFRLGGE